MGSVSRYVSRYELAQLVGTRLLECDCNNELMTASEAETEISEGRCPYILCRTFTDGSKHYFTVGEDGVLGEVPRASLPR